MELVKNGHDNKCSEPGLMKDEIIDMLEWEGKTGKLALPAGILKREAERQEKMVQKKKEILEGTAGTTASQLEVFYSSFREKEMEITKALSSLSLHADNRSKLQEIFKEISDNITCLNNHVSSYSLLLRPYDLRRCIESVQKMQEDSTSAEKKYLPKKKFGFRSKVNRTDVIDGPVKTSNIIPVTNLVKEDGLGFWNRSNEVLRMTPEITFNQDITLSNLEGCNVVIQGCPNIVYMHSLTDCTVVLGPVKTSILLYVCRNSTIAAMCQQMRIHKTTKSDFYIHVTTKAIIEDSKDVRFAPYNCNYPGLTKDVEKSGLDTSSNNWDDIDDFNWLVNNMHSPNWSTLPEEERRQSDSWPS